MLIINCTIMYYDLGDVKDWYHSKIGTLVYHFNYDFGDPSVTSVEQ